MAEQISEMEAIKRIKECRNTPNFQPYHYMNQALDMAISALEKQEMVSRTIVEGEYFCPRCKYVMRHPGYCRTCGQHAY